MRRRARRRLARPRVPQVPALQPDVRWLMDFVRDTLADRRVFRLSTLVDDRMRSRLALELAPSFPRTRVAAVRDQVVARRGLPHWIVCDNGPEFISRALAVWAARREIELHHIQPGKPNQNAHVESLNNRLRDECLISTGSWRCPTHVASSATSTNSATRRIAGVPTGNSHPSSTRPPLRRAQVSLFHPGR